MLPSGFSSIVIFLGFVSLWRNVSSVIINVTLWPINGYSFSLSQYPFTSAGAALAIKGSKMNVNRKKNFFMIFILLGIIIINPDIAAAVDSDIINKIVKSFADKTGKWTDIAKKYAKIIFYWCAILEIAWLGIKMSLSGADIKDTLKNFCITVVVCGFFLAVINNYYEWSRQVISGLLAISGEMGNIQNASDDAFKKGLDLCQQLFSALKEISILEDGALLLGSLAALFIVIVCFCQITAQVIFIVPLREG